MHTIAPDRAEDWNLVAGLHILECISWNAYLGRYIVLGYIRLDTTLRRFTHYCQYTGSYLFGPTYPTHPHNLPSRTPRPLPPRQPPPSPQSPPPPSEKANRIAPGPLTLTVPRHSLADHTAAAARRHSTTARHNRSRAALAPVGRLARNLAATGAVRLAASAVPWCRAQAGGLR